MTDSAIAYTLLGVVLFVLGLVFTPFTPAGIVFFMVTALVTVTLFALFTGA